MRSFKFFVFTIILSLSGTHSYGQITIDGMITDSELNPISNALVEIIDETDINNVYSDVTDASGNFSIANITDIEGRPTTVPTDHIVLRNYPNPFNPTTMIYFELPKAENIEIKIYDILGREVRTLYNNSKKAGIYHMTWDGRNNFGGGVAAGIYFCRLKTKDQFKVHKMVLLDGGSNASFPSNTNLKKISAADNLLKTNSNFNFTVKVSAGNILASDFKYLSCSSDTTLNLIVPKILQTAIIGPEGGKLETEDFSLTIPSGAFPEVTELKLGTDQTQTDFSNNRLSDVFLIEGFPQLINKHVRVQIKNNGIISDSTYIVVGKYESDILQDTDELFYSLFPARDSIGYLVTQFKLPNIYPSPTLGNNNIGKSTADGKWSLLSFLGIGGHKSLNHVSLHFDYIHPNDMPLEKVEFLGNSVENAFTKFLEIGFSYGPPVVDQTVKMKIPIKKMNTNTLGLWNAFRPEGLPIVVIEGVIDRDVLIDLDEKTIKRQAASLFFGLIPFWYDFDRYNSFGRQWIYIASRTWAGTLFPQDNEYVPSEIFGNEMEPFRGIEINPSLIDPDIINNHGFGMSSVIKYLCNNSLHGSKVIVNIYKELKTKDFPFEAINIAMEKPIHIWWPNFFKEYLRGNIYKIPSNEFLKNTSKTIALNIGDTRKNVNETYNDLSAKLFRININSDEIKNRTLNFKLGPESLSLGSVKVLVFGISNEQLVFLGDGNNFNIRGLQYYQSLLACVVNSINEPPYTGTSNINLDIEVTDDLVFKYCDINFAVIEMHDTLEGVWSPGWYTDGVFKDNVFTGTINKERQGGNVNGTIKIEVDDNQNILSLSVMAYHNDPTGFSSQWGFTAKNIPPTENEPYLLVYSYSGNSVCNYVKSIYAKYIEVDGDETEIKNFKCDDESVLHIKFHNWD